MATVSIKTVSSFPSSSRDAADAEAAAYEGEVVYNETTDEFDVIAETIDYVAGIGDWVILLDGSRATVVKANPAVIGTDWGAYYGLLLRGGDEVTCYDMREGGWKIARGLFGEPEPVEHPPFIVVAAN
jgi:hypothetical protein